MNQIAGSRDLAAATGSEVPHHLNDIIGLVTLRSVYYYYCYYYYSPVPRTDTSLWSDSHRYEMTGRQCIYLWVIG